MSLPFFYLSSYNRGETDFVLMEDNSRHILQVLRMKPGESLFLTDGKGHLLTVTILDDHKKKCRVRVESVAQQPRPENKVAIGISLLKNAGRFEWFLEKAMEIGVSAIIPLLCERTEKQHFRRDRMQSILVSALLQSRQTWLPELSEPLPFARLMTSDAIPAGDNVAAGDTSDRTTDRTMAVSRLPPFSGDTFFAHRYIAYCLEEHRLSLADTIRGKGRHNGTSLILIGPEGDFSREEIDDALQRGFLPVTLGDTRLRTETAGIVAATLLCIGAQDGIRTF